MTWHDDGLKVRLYVSEAGDFVSLGTRTDYPFQSGGSYGIPLGWNPNTVDISRINWTTANGVFSTSNKPGTPGTGITHSIFRSFNLKVGKHYIVTVEARTMDNKTATSRVVNQQVLGGPTFGLTRTSQPDWEDIASVNDPGFTKPETMYVVLGVIDGPTNDWGVQFTNMALTEIDDVYPPPTWYEVTCDIRNLSVRLGRERIASRYQVGTMTLGINNNDGEWTYQPNHPHGLRPGRFIKVEASYNGFAYPTFYGIIDGLSDSYSVDGRVTTNLSAVDVSSLLSNTEVPTVNDPTTTLLSSSRISQILRAIGWHPQMKGIAPGVFWQQAILNNGRTVLDEMGLTADSEGSYLFADRTGRLIYWGRDWATDRVTKVGAELLAQPEPVPFAVPDVQFVFPQIVNNYIDTPTTTPLQVLGDIEIVARIIVNSWANNQFQTIVGNFVDAAGGWSLTKIASQKRFAAWIANGNRVSGADVPYGDGVPFWLKVTRVQSTGVTTWSHAADSDSEPTTWTVLTTNTIAAGTGQIATTSPVAVGARWNGTQPYGGRIQRVIVRSGPTKVLDFGEADGYGQAGALSLIASSGQTMTVHQTGSNVIVQDDTSYELLPVVDAIPDISPNIPVICTRDLQTSWSRDRVINEISLANQGGRAVTVIDQDSQQKYGPRTYQRMDLLNDNNHPEYLTLRIADLMDGYTDAMLRVDKIAFRPGPDSWPYALGVWLNDLVRIRYENLLHDWGYSVVAHVQGIEHVADSKNWVTTLSVDDYLNFNYWSGSVPGQGWDEGIWDQNLWDGGFIAKWSTGQVWSDPTTIWGA